MTTSTKTVFTFERIPTGRNKVWRLEVHTMKGKTSLGSASWEIPVKAIGNTAESTCLPTAVIVSHIQDYVEFLCEKELTPRVIVSHIQSGFGDLADRFSRLESTRKPDYEAIYQESCQRGVQSKRPPSKDSSHLGKRWDHFDERQPPGRGR